MTCAFIYIFKKILVFIIITGFYQQHISILMANTHFNKKRTRWKANGNDSFLLAWCRIELVTNEIHSFLLPPTLYLLTMRTEKFFVKCYCSMWNRNHFIYEVSDLYGTEKAWGPKCLLSQKQCIRLTASTAVLKKRSEPALTPARYMTFAFILSFYGYSYCWFSNELLAHPTTNKFRIFDIF